MARSESLGCYQASDTVADGWRHVHRARHRGHHRRDLYRLRRKRPDAPGHLITRVHDLIVEQLDDRVSDYEIDGSWPGTDPDDVHIHAAAVASGAGVVLTSDSGFTTADPAGLPYEVYTPDNFVLLVDDSAPSTVRAVAAAQLRYWLDKGGEADLPARLCDAGCFDFAERVRTHLALQTSAGD